MLLRFFLPIYRFLIRKIYNFKYRFQKFVLKKSYNVTHAIHEQNILFSHFKLDRNDGLNLINKVVTKLFKTSYQETKGMFSEHLVLFSSIAKNNKNIKNILEIGTYDGKTSLILSELFPTAQITTIDLPKNSKDFKNSYLRNFDSNAFVINRNKILKKSKRIKFIPCNSLELLNWKNNQFDFIWIDGAHSLPIITSDIINSIRLVKSKGWILIDDVFLDNRQINNIYESIGAKLTLDELSKSKTIKDFKLFKKRVGLEFSLPMVKKYIAVIKF